MTTLAQTIYESSALIRHLEAAALAVVFSNPTEAVRLVLLASLCRPGVRW
jgi:hypothetical protein